MRRTTVICWIACLLATTAWADRPEMEIRTGSTVRIDLAGAAQPIEPQFVGLGPSSQGGLGFASTEAILLPRFDIAFGEQVRVLQNQEFEGTLDKLSGVAELSFPVWIIDGDGNGVELTADLTTGVPSTLECSGSSACQGIQGEPDFCEGSVWTAPSGELQLVGVVVVPPGSGLSIECAVVSFVLDATLPDDDIDTDNVLDVVDSCPDDPNGTLPQADSDGDGVGDACDNCAIANRQQRDLDTNGVGDACEPVLINFQPATSTIPPGYIADTGSAFNGTYGWLDGFPRDTRERGINPDPRLDTLVQVNGPQNWASVLDPGRYDISLVVGDAAFGHQHNATIEGRVAFEDAVTGANEFLQSDHLDLTVLDGRLNITAGANVGQTTLNYLTCVESEEQPFFSRYVNFAIAASQTPIGWIEDVGAMYDPVAGYGWDVAVQSRERGIDPNPLRDTLAFSIPVATWEIDVPADFYEVAVVLGDPAFDEGPGYLEVEGQVWLTDTMIPKGQFFIFEQTLTVVDGALTVRIGGDGGATPINFVSISSLDRDADGDGTVNFSDNCPEQANPGQEDTDSDGIGDACNDALDVDGDEWSDLTDNCPQQANPGQENQDGDFRGDVCDCAATDPGSFALVAEVSNLRLTGGASALIYWDSQDGSAGTGTNYDVVSISLATLRGSGSYAAAVCLENDRPVGSASDSGVLAPGEGIAYLVRAQNACGTGTYGVSDVVPDPRATLDGSGPCP